MHTGNSSFLLSFTWLRGWLIRTDVVSQGVWCGFWHGRSPLLWAWLLVKSTEGMSVALLGRYRSREVPKLFLLEERDKLLLFFLILL